ncbi:hypothetical protein [Burkholderia anthina]|uniref:hypothetical protein n=1 Tax=Burkholderia anthina TaxID=179879 RepID=UPI00158DAA23|nr:hypothetical protein [Burkholderia anthina]
MAGISIPFFNPSALSGSIQSNLLTQAVPSSQMVGDRPISLVLQDATLGQVLGSFSFAIRPEELTRTEVSRMTVQQTLGGAWADDFGPGMATINLSGHTGWRGAQGIDGMAQFANLKSTVFDAWHVLRKSARTNGLDPSGIQLIFADALDSTTDIVAPLNFTLRRSKSRPLLMQFQISLVTLDVATADSLLSGAVGLLESLGLDSLASALNNLTGAISSISGWVQSNVLGPLNRFLGVAQSVFNAVYSVVRTGVGPLNQLLGLAVSVAHAGMNIFNTLAATVGVAASGVAAFMGTAGVFSDILCLVSNAFGKARVYQNYTALYGASNCSSTAGGEPVSQYVINGVNPFFDVVGTSTKPPFTVSPTAQSNLTYLANNDVVQNPMTETEIGYRAGIVADGISDNGVVSG